MPIQRRTRHPMLVQISDQAMAVVVHPQRFFRQLPAAGGFAAATRLIVAASLIGAVLFVIAHFAGLGPPVTAAVAFAMLIAAPIVLILVALVMTPLLFGLLRIMGARTPVIRAYQTYAYIYAIWPITTVLGLIPGLQVVGVVWTAWLLALASVEAHRVRPGRAYTVFALLALLAIIGLYTPGVAIWGAHGPGAPAPGAVTPPHSAPPKLPVGTST